LFFKNHIIFVELLLQSNCVVKELKNKQTTSSPSHDFMQQWRSMETHWNHSLPQYLFTFLLCFLGEVFNVLSVCGDFIHISVIMW